MDATKKAEFLTKLKELLKEYDATISFSCDDGSDTHGLTGDKIVISVGNPAKGKFASEDIHETNGWHMDSSDL